MSLMAFFVIGLVCVVFWRQVLALIAAGVVVLFMAGVAFAADAVVNETSASQAVTLAITVSATVC